MRKLLLSLACSVFLLGLMPLPEAQAYPGPYATNAPIHMFFDFASYSTGPFLCEGETLACYNALINWQFTNSFVDYSSSGDGVQDDWKDNFFRYNICFLHDYTNAISYNLFGLSENGGYSTNVAIQWTTNMISSPAAGFWDGFVGAVVDEGVTTGPVVHYMMNSINDNPYLDPNKNLQYAQTGFYIQGIGWSVVNIDIWGMTYTNGLNVDIDRLFGFYTGGHPYRAGSLGMGLWTLVGLGARTNIGSICIDWGGGRIAATNHMTGTSASQSGNTFTFTLMCDGMPPGWDHGIGTNDADNCFVIYPTLARIFTWTFQATNLTAGVYDAYLNGILVDTATDVQWAAGRNWLTNTVGPLWNQRVTLLWDCRDMYGLDKVTLQQVGFNGSLGPNLLNLQSNAKLFPNTFRGTNFINNMRDVHGWPANLNKYFVKMHDDAKPQFLRFDLVKRGGVTSRMRVRVR